MILDAVDQAIQRAKYHDRPFDREQVGVVVGTVFGGDYAAQLVVDLRLPEFQERLADLLRKKVVPEGLVGQLVPAYGEVLLTHMPALLDETGSFTASALASRITKSFDLMGGAVAVDAGQASSMAALNCCVDQLRSGDCEMMICVGGQYDMTPVLYEGWSINGRLAVGETRSPFDVRADGTLPAEGCGALLLKRLADARRDHDPIFGIIRGIGASYDPCQAEAARLAIRRALRDSSLCPADIAIVETSVVGKANEDAVQLHGIAEAYAERPGTPPLLLSTVVGQIGDAGGTAGMASLLKAAMEVENLHVPAESRLEHPAPYLTSHAVVLTVPSGPSAIAANAQGRVIAGIHSGSAGEVNYHVYIERGIKMNLHPKKELAEHAMEGSQAGSDMAGRIHHFDATERRRRKLREKGAVTRLPQAAPVRRRPTETMAVRLPVWLNGTQNRPLRDASRLRQRRDQQRSRRRRLRKPWLTRGPLPSRRRRPNRHLLYFPQCPLPLLPPLRQLHRRPRRTPWIRRSWRSFWWTLWWSTRAIRRRSSSWTPISRPIWASTASRRPSCSANWASTSTSVLPRTFPWTASPPCATCSTSW